jgi:nucleoside-diphosphate-sugar epimerase
MSKTALVTGGCGFIGSHIVDELVLREFDVTVIDNHSADCHEQFYHNDNARYHNIDITQYDAIEPLFSGIDYVFHAAAEARIQPSIENPRLAFQTNAIGTLNVLEASRKSTVKRVLYSSTSSAYGLKNSSPMVETMERDCLNPYSVSKCAGEDLCKMYYDLYGVETVVFRYFNVYGERQPTNGQYAPVIGLFQKQYREGNYMTVVGDGQQTRDYTHVSDIVNANMTMAFYQGRRGLGTVFNVGTGKSCSVLDLVSMIGGVYGKYRHIAERPAEARFTEANIDKLRSFGWEPSIDLKTWLEQSK